MSGGDGGWDGRLYWLLGQLPQGVELGTTVTSGLVPPLPGGHPRIQRTALVTNLEQHLKVLKSEQFNQVDKRL